MKPLAAMGALTLALLFTPAGGGAALSATDLPNDATYAEDIPAPPGPGYLWVPGHIEVNYATRRWQYIKAAWVMPPVPGAQYIPGKWTRGMEKYGWNPGHWAAYPDNKNGAVQPVSMVVTNAPPPDLIEQVYAAPSASYSWVGGYWWWCAHKEWIWAPGYFSRVPRPRDRWISARWEERDEGGWRFVPGHWRR
ncbi:MAG TPA: hypothetical protein VFE31_00975 [Opitutaceae bacterium]|jgi:hypothetical protein|nr:hypothetical protein [Opitutaceae bacterium]